MCFLFPGSSFFYVCTLGLCDDKAYIHYIVYMYSHTFFDGVFIVAFYTGLLVAMDGSNLSLLFVVLYTGYLATTHS